MAGWKSLLALMGICSLVPGAARAEWLQAKTPHFILYSESNESRLREFAEKLEKFDFLLREVTLNKQDSGLPVHVYLLSNDSKVEKLARDRNIGGFYSTSDRFAYAVLPRGGKEHQFDFGAEEILFHEYTHHFMLHYFPAAYPKWYVEGFAEFFSVVKFPKDGSIEFGYVPIPRAPALLMDSPYPLAELLSRSTDGMSARDGDRFYGTAWLLTHYFQYGSRRAEIKRYLDDLAKGVPDMKLDSYFAGGIAGLEKDLRAYMRQRLNITRMAPRNVTVGEISITPVDPVRGALIENELRLLTEPLAEELPQIVTSIRSISAKFPPSPYALSLLAEAEWKADQKEAALVDVDRAIALNPDLSQAHALRAQLLLDRAHDSDKEEDWNAARSAIVKANRADVEDPVPLALYYRYHAMRGVEMPQIGYDALAKSYSLLPQNSDYRMSYVHALAAKGDYATASRLLDPLAYSPHDSELRRAALQLKTQYDVAAKEKKPGVR